MSTKNKIDPDTLIKNESSYTVILKHKTEQVKAFDALLTALEELKEHHPDYPDFPKFLTFISFYNGNIDFPDSIEDNSDDE